MTDGFVLDMFDDALVIIPLGEARRLAALNDALETSVTWGEFLTSVGSDVETRIYLDDSYDDGLPHADESFDPDELPGFSDGIWPSFPKQAMLDWLPQSLLKLGTIKTTVFGGSFLHIEGYLAADVIRALANEGIDCQEDTEDLVLRACGQWRYS
jgi:hypothetical protein